MRRFFDVSKKKKARNIWWCNGPLLPVKGRFPTEGGSEA